MIGHAVHPACRLAYVRNGDGPPVLFIQGVGLHGDGWRPQTEALRDAFDCLWFDNRGIGGSDAGPTPLTVEQMADDCAAILDANEWPSAHIVGHSLGGLIALRLALAAPARVRSLALLCTFASGREAAPLTWRMMTLGARTRIGTRRMRRRAFLQLIMSPAGLADVGDLDALADRLAPLFGHDLADQPPVVNRQLKAMRNYSAASQLGQLAGVPTLVLSAGHDPIAPPAAGRRLAGEIPGARFVEWPDASHGAPIEFAERTNALLREHLAAAEHVFGRAGFNPPHGNGGLKSALHD